MKPLGDMLVERRAITADDLAKAQQIQESAGGNLGALLVGIGAVSEDVLLQTQGEQLGIVYLRTPEDMPDNLAVYQFMVESPIKTDWLLDNHVLLWREDDGLKCLARDIQDRALHETLGYFYPNESTTFYLAANHQIDRLLEGVRKERAMETLFSGDDARQLRELAEEAPIIALVNNLLAQAVDLEASDIHVEPAEEQFTVRMRVDGVLHTRLTQPIERFPAVASRIKLVAGIDIAERRLPQDGRIGERISGRDMDIRVSTVPCAFGESIVLRLLAQERSDLSLTNLGMEADHLAMFRGWLHASNGIVLVTGPTGSGKSTTLAGALEEVDDGVKKIITVEDPIEYQIPSITQIQVHAEIGYTFAPRAAAHPASGSGRDHDRRDPRPGDRGNRDPVRADRPRGSVHVAHQRRRIELHAAHRHGRGAVPRGRTDPWRPGPAPGAPSLSALRETGTALAARRRPAARHSGGPGRRQLDHHRGLRPLPAHGLPRANGHLRTGADVRRTAEHDRRRRSAQRPQALRPPRVRLPHSAAGRPHQGVARQDDRRGSDAADPHRHGRPNAGVSARYAGLPRPASGLARGRDAHGTCGCQDATGWRKLTGVMEYDYEVIDGSGRTVTGQLEAESPADVVRALSRDGQTVVNVSERMPSALPTFQRRLRPVELVVAFHELATLLESGVALGDAILAQGRGTYHPALAKAFAGIGRDLMRGLSFLQALRASGLPLPDYVYQLVEAGELSGRLPQSLREAVDQLEYDQRVATDIKSALVYPSILIASGIGVVLLVFMVVVPEFATLLEDADDLHFLSEAVLRSGVWFNDNTWLVVGIMAGVALVAAALLRRRSVRQRIVDAVARLPVVGAWLTETDTAKWASVMSAMLSARVELMDALVLAARGVRISRRKAMLDGAIGDVRGGSALSEALEKQSALTPTGYNLVRVGEQSGQLAQMMRALATLYENNSARRMKRVVALIEPIAILLIGGALGTIMIGLILAITNANAVA